MKRFLPLILFSALVILFASQLMHPRVQGSIDSPLIGKTFPSDIITPIPEGPFVLNFFASWCAPCAIEHPFLMQMKKDGVTIIGVVFKDDTKAIEAFIKKHGNPYQNIVYDLENKSSITMGITGVPESFAVNKNHIIRARQQGPLEDAQTIESFLKALKS